MAAARPATACISAHSAHLCCTLALLDARCSRLVTAAAAAGAGPPLQPTAAALLRARRRARAESAGIESRKFLQHSEAYAQQQQQQQQQGADSLQGVLQQLQDAHDTVALAAATVQQLEMQSAQLDEQLQQNPRLLGQQHSSATRSSPDTALTAAAAAAAVRQRSSNSSGARSPCPEQQLTAELRAASGNPAALARLLDSAGRTATRLNAVHLTVAAEGLARAAAIAAPQGTPGAASRHHAALRGAWRRVMAHLEGQLLELDARGVASLARVTARLGAAHPSLRAPALLGDLLHVSASQLEGFEFEPRQLAMLAYAAAAAAPWAVGSLPGRRWWTAFFAASMAAMTGHKSAYAVDSRQQEAATAVGAGASSSINSINSSSSSAGGFTPQGYSNMVWALGRLQRRPGPEWAAALYAATQPQLAGFNSQGLANLLLGIAAMHDARGLPPPGADWLSAFLAATRPQLQGFSSQGLANVLWALAKLGYVPPRADAAALLSASSALLSSGCASAADLALSVYACARLRLRPPDSWWSAYWAAWDSAMDDASGQALANTLWALARLRQSPPPLWLQAYFPALQLQLPRCSSQAVSNVLWAASRLQLLRPRGAPTPWLTALLARTQALLPGATAREQAVCISALQRLSYHPGEHWLARFYAASQPRLPSYTSRQLAATLRALGGLLHSASRQPPPSEWAHAAIVQVSARLPLLSAPALCDTLWGLAQLGVQPGQELMGRFFALSAEKLSLMDGPMLARVASALAALRAPPNAAWLALLVDEARCHLCVVPAEALADLLWALGRLHYSPGSSWLDVAAAAAAPALPSLPAGALCQMLSGAAALRLRPGREWLGAAAARVAQLLGDMSGQDLLVAAAALEQLGLAPAPVLLQALLATDGSGLQSGEAVLSALAPPVAAAAAAGGGHQTPAAATIQQQQQQQQQQQHSAEHVQPTTGCPSTVTAAAAAAAAGDSGSTGVSATPQHEGQEARKQPQQRQQIRSADAADCTVLLPRPQLPRGTMSRHAAFASSR